MTLFGRFGDTTGRPHVEGRLYVPRLDVQSDVLFMVDTGADETALLPDDCERIGLDYSALRPGAGPAVGIGGFSRSYTEQAVIVFREPNRMLHCYRVDLGILEPAEHLAGAPSLLGRDILKHWLMRYSPPTNRLTFRVASAHRQIPIN